MSIIYKCIDVSKHNGTIDFEKVKKSGIQSVILRGGFGTSNIDEKFKINIENASKHGLHIGVYWFGYAYTIDRAKKEAEKCYNLIKNYDCIDLPIFYDWENDSYSYAVKNGVTPNQKLISDMTIAFCDYLEKKGYFVGVYSNLDYLTRFYNKTVKNKYTIWVAQWSSKCTYTQKYGIWQYSEKGKVDGVSGNVDMNYIYIDYPKLIKELNLNNFKSNSKNYHYDVNNDGKIDSKDLLALKNKLLNSEV